MNYKEKVIKGLCKSTEIDNHIDYWHDIYDGELELHEFLGLDISEYSTYVNWEDDFHEYINNLN